MIKARNLCVQKDGRLLLSDINIEVRPGWFLAVAGPNGAGKTTLIRTLTGFLPYTGSATLDGREIASFKPRDIARETAVLFQQQSAEAGFSVRQVVSMGRYAHRKGLLDRSDPDGTSAVEEAIRLCGLSDIAGRPIATLSGGERQKVFLAQALCRRPRILMLDEPANHLDLPFVLKLFSLVDEWRKTPGRAVICVVHDLTLARNYATHALLLKDGKGISFGEAQDALSDSNLTSAYESDIAAAMKIQSRVWR